MLGLVVRMGVDYKLRRKECAADIVHRFPFSSDKKRMSTVVKQPDGTTRVYTKGASEMILKLCSSIVDESGAVVDLSDEEKAAVSPCSPFLGVPL